MVRNVLLAVMLAASMIAVPQSAAASRCGLNCVLVTVIDAHGNVQYTYWECEVQMDCVEP